MKKYQLGGFEEVVMLTVGILYNDAYGVSVKKEIEQRLSRKVSVGALQSALKRLEDKGYLKSHEERQHRSGQEDPSVISLLRHWASEHLSIPRIHVKIFGRQFRR